MQQNRPDLIVLDLVMPDLDGWKVTRTLRQESAWQDLPIIIVSASTLPADESQCYLSGANAFLAKPLSFDRLLRLLEEHLKLEWIDRDGSTRSLLTPQFSATQVEAHTDSESLVTPSVAQLTQLLELAIQGDIRGVLSRIDQWQRDQPRFTPFVQQVNQLAENCQLKKLKELLRTYIDRD